ncbi:hypothetical protein MTO96_001381 [Rhipicephalus appendiculatus]
MTSDSISWARRESFFRSGGQAIPAERTAGIVARSLAAVAAGCELDTRSVRQLQCALLCPAWTVLPNGDKVTRVVLVTPLSRPRPLAHALSLLRRPFLRSFIVLLVCAFSSRSSLHQTLFLSAEASAACAWLTARGLFDKEAARASAASWRPRWCAMRPFTMKETDHHASASHALSGSSESGHLVRAASVIRHGVQGVRMFGMVALSMCNFKYPAFLPRGPAKMARKFGVACLPVARQIEKGNDLLEEVAMTSSVAGSAKSTQELAVSLKHHLECFTEKLEDTREKLEDTSRCYLLLDHSYEWALDAMKFVSSMKMDTASTPESMTQLMRLLQDYQEEHPAPSEQNFSEMLDLSSKLDNPKLVEQCKTAQARCRETAELDGSAPCDVTASSPAAGARRSQIPVPNC